jgi:hypothetical protein
VWKYCPFSQESSLCIIGLYCWWWNLFSWNLLTNCYAFPHWVVVIFSHMKMQTNIAGCCTELSKGECSGMDGCRRHSVPTLHKWEHWEAKSTFNWILGSYSGNLSQNLLMTRDKIWCMIYLSSHEKCYENYSSLIFQSLSNKNFMFDISCLVHEVYQNGPFVIVGCMKTRALELGKKSNDVCMLINHWQFLLCVSFVTNWQGVLHTTGGYMVYTATTFKYAFDYHDDDIYWYFFYQL